MSLDHSLHETEILSDIRVLLEQHIDASIDVEEDPQIPAESPVLIVNYKGKYFMIAVECLESDE